MRNYYVTFPQKDVGRRNGWIRILAKTHDDAINWAKRLYGDQYYRVYTENEWDPFHFPAGELDVIA